LTIATKLVRFSWSGDITLCAIQPVSHVRGIIWLVFFSVWGLFTFRRFSTDDPQLDQIFQSFTVYMLIYGARTGVTLTSFLSFLYSLLPVLCCPTPWTFLHETSLGAVPDSYSILCLPLICVAGIRRDGHGERHFCFVEFRMGVF